MDSKKKNDFPDLSLLASTFWISDPQYSPLNNHSSTHEIESLKLYAHIIWPAADMYNERRTFLAHCALRLQDKYNRTADLVRHRKDGLRRSAELRSWITQIYTHAADLGKEHLLLPFGGLDAALERGRIEIETDIDRRLREANTALSVGDFILRYLAHMENGRHTASVNKAVYFIEGGGYQEHDLPLRRHKDQIMAAWSQCKPSIAFSLAAYYSEPVFLSNIFRSPDPSGALEEVWYDDFKRERFFGIARYCESELSSFTPIRSKVPLLGFTSGTSTINLHNLTERCPTLKAFTEKEREDVSKYRALKKYRK